ncbi:hypothetical protein MMR14E_04290 [Methylobacterium mesophilicum]
MRALGLAVAVIGLASTLPANALPLSSPAAVVSPTGIVQARVVSRTVVVRRPACRTVVTKRRGPGGRVIITRTRRCG